MRRLIDYCDTQANEIYDMDEEDRKDRMFARWAYTIIGFIITGLIIMLSSGCAYSSEDKIPKDKVILAVIGEAEDQDFIGMIGIACAIRNRGTLKGVYGLNAPRVINHKYSQGTYDLAYEAVEIASNERTLDYCTFIKGADYWESIKFKKSYWAKDMVETYRHGDHVFYRKKG